MKIVAFLFCVGVSLAFNADYSDELGEELDPDELDRIANEINLQNKRERLVKFETDWPSDEVWEKLGAISAAVPLDPSGTQTLVLHRADRVWDETTFNEENIYRNASQGPISVGVLAHLNSGNLVGSHLKNRFYMPHGLSVDHQGNVWITDVALHQIFKFSPDLKETPLLILGEALRPGNDDKHFCKPTHVVVASSGEFFVSDGYCNSRVMKFDPNGKLLKQWGEKPTDTTDPGPYELFIPHEMILVEQEDLLCVADRENYRAICYRAGLTSSSKNQTGQYVSEIRLVDDRAGPVYGIAYCPHTRSIFLLVGPSDEVEEAEVQVYDLETGQYLGRIADDIQGYGDAHTISTCGSLKGSGCLMVSSLTQPSVDYTGQPRRRMWLYRLLSATVD